MSVGADTIIKEPWTSTCALLCIPGGADLGYCKSLNGPGNQRITQYIRRGGKYIGFCAGAYFASSAIEFEKGNVSMEVSGKRELGFFPGICRGTAFKGFKYNSEAGARACALEVADKLVDLGSPARFSCYYNGGGAFVDAHTYTEQGVEVLARYQQPIEIDGGGDRVAAVGCRIGSGYSLLIGTHPEFAASSLRKTSDQESYPELLKALEENEPQRLQFMTSCFKLLGLKTNAKETAPPKLSKLHVSCLDIKDVSVFMQTLSELKEPNYNGDGYGFIQGENDDFLLEDQRSHPTEDRHEEDPPAQSVGSQSQVQKPLFRLKVHNEDYPTLEETPYFNWSTYFQHLGQEGATAFGSPLLYGEVITSTNTILDKNFKLLQKLSSGFTAVATIQTAGRGRGSNVWVSPVGVLVFSTLVRHKLEHVSRAPVIFIQYLVALAIVNSIKSYGEGYDEVPVFLKWPNDIYSRNLAESSPESKKFVKIGGILVNASFSGDEFLLVVGCGINTTNEAPTTSLNLLLRLVNKDRTLRGLAPLPPYQGEVLLAKIMARFQRYYEKFQDSGFRPFEQDYYRSWLHSGQIVNIEPMGGVKAQIRGLSMDDGMLVVDELDEYNNKTGKTYSLQTDGNSFDFFNGLLKKKT
ncbi:hypothetical protein ABW19_dt0200963 [Dactylella cylindrospora]|nr:hypothetical protein ABW19_dt0200963 [Dactylella cylindrospora]